MDKMKILEVTHRFPPAIGGCEKVVYELSKEMVKQGHDVTVLTSTSIKDTDTRGLSTGRGISLRSDLDGYTEEDFDGVRVLRFPPDFQLFTFAPNKMMRDFLKNHIGDYDIVHVHGYLMYEAFLVSKYSDNFILTAHDVVSHHPGIFRLMKRIYDHVLGKRILRRASKLIALTPANRDEYLSVLDDPEKIEIIPNGINKYEKISSSKKREILKDLGNPSHVILFVGRIVEYKGCQDIIEAMPDIVSKYPDTKAVFVGVDGGYTKTLKMIAAKAGVSERCVFTGEVNSIGPYLNVADVFVFPSQGEGFGLSPVEAMSMGIPSVMTDVGGLKYVLAWVGGYRIDPSKDIPSQISTYVQEIFYDENMEKKMKDVSDKARRFRWPGIAKKTLKIFDETRSKSHQ